MKKNALIDIKNLSVKIAIEAVEKLIKNSLDNNKLENLYNKSLQEAKISFKKTKIDKSNNIFLQCKNITCILLTMV